VSPKIVDRKAKRAEIAGIALDVFAEHGLDVPIERVARAAKIGKGTVYQYYRSKTELIVDSVLSYFEHLDQLTQDESRQFDNPEERLRFEVKSIVKTLLEDKRYSQIVVGILRLTNTRDGQRMDRALNREVNRRFVTLITNRILEGISTGDFRPEVARDTELLAMNMIAFADGLWFSYYLERGDIHLEEQLDFYLNTFFDYLRKGPAHKERNQTKATQGGK
jgi:AcrR family transcriptional regulator